MEHSSFKIYYSLKVIRETTRQLNNIKASQERELQALEEAQKAQFVEFSEAWDKYMNDYEETAMKSLEKLKVSRRKI